MNKMNRFLNSFGAIVDKSLCSKTATGVSNSLINHESRRYGRRYRKWHHWSNDFLPFHWERPTVDPPYLRTNDAIRDIGKWDPKALVPGAEHSEELKNAPECVRRLFTLEFAERKTIVQHQRNKIVQEVQRHPFDDLSPEVSIAKMTVRIRNNLHHFLKICKDDARRKIVQNDLIFKRQSKLKELYYQDRERFDYIIKKLGIKFEPTPLGANVMKPTRKGELRRLTAEYCENIRQKRLEEYHQELKSKQPELEQEIKEIEKLLTEEDKYLGTLNNSK